MVRTGKIETGALDAAPKPGELRQYTIIWLAAVCTFQLASYTAITIVCEPLLIQLAALFQVNENGAVVEVP